MFTRQEEKIDMWKNEKNKWQVTIIMKFLREIKTIQIVPAIFLFNLIEILTKDRQNSTTFALSTESICSPFLKSNIGLIEKFFEAPANQ